MPAAPYMEDLERVLGAWSGGDFSTTAELLDPELEFSWEESPSTIRGNGLEELGTRFADFLRQWADYRVIPRAIRELGQGAALVESQQVTTGKASGVTTELPMYIAWRFRDGRAVAMHWSPDRSRALARAGLEDQPPNG